MIRAGQDDLPKFVSLCRDFHNTHWDANQPLNEDKIRLLFNQHTEYGVVYLTDDGFIAGLILDDPVHDWTALVETFWFAQDGQGLALLNAFIAFGRGAGVQEVRMTTLSTSHPGADKLLARKGFQLIEKSHRLIL